MSIDIWSSIFLFTETKHVHFPPRRNSKLENREFTEFFVQFFSLNSLTFRACSQRCFHNDFFYCLHCLIDHSSRDWLTSWIGKLAENSFWFFKDATLNKIWTRSTIWKSIKVVTRNKITIVDPIEAVTTCCRLFILLSFALAWTWNLWHQLSASPSSGFLLLSGFGHVVETRSTVLWVSQRSEESRLRITLNQYFFMFHIGIITFKVHCLWRMMKCEEVKIS